MSIRMSSNQFMYNYQQTLNRSYQQQQALFEQADGSKFHRASDDPVTYSKLMRYKYTENENEQYKKNVNSAVAWMNNTDNNLVLMKDNIQTFVTKTSAAANDYNTTDEFNSIAAEMMSVIEDTVSNCNAQMGDRYLFAGQKDMTHPFTLSENTVDRGVAKSLNAEQSQFFKKSSGGAASALSQMLQLESDKGDIYYLDTKSGYVYEKDFVENKYKDLITKGYTSINDSDMYGNVLADQYSAGKIDIESSADNDGFKVADAFTSQGLLREDVDSNSVTANSQWLDYDSDNNVAGLKVTFSGDTDATVLKFSTINQLIVTYSGDTNSVSMAKLNGALDGTSDVVNVNGEDMWGRDIFDDESSGNDASGAAMLNNLITVYAKTKAGDVTWLNSDGVTLSNVTHATLSVAQTTLGSRIQLYTMVGDMLDTQATNLTQEMTDLGGADIAQLATKLMEYTTLYNLALSLGGRVLPQSLADYL